MVRARVPRCFRVDNKHQQIPPFGRNDNIGAARNLLAAGFDLAADAVEHAIDKLH